MAVSRIILKDPAGNILRPWTNAITDGAAGVITINGVPALLETADAPGGDVVIEVNNIAGVRIGNTNRVNIAITGDNIPYSGTDSATLADKIATTSSNIQTVSRSLSSSIAATSSMLSSQVTAISEYAVYKVNDVTPTNNEVSVYAGNMRMGDTGTAEDNMTVSEYIAAEVAKANNLKVEVLEYGTALEDVANPQQNTIYLKPESSNADTAYDEYIYMMIDGSGKWELIGTTNIDLSGYVTDSELSSQLSSKANIVNGRSVANGRVTIYGSNIALTASDTTKVATAISNLGDRVTTLENATPSGGGIGATSIALIRPESDQSLHLHIEVASDAMFNNIISTIDTNTSSAVNTFNIIAFNSHTWDTYPWSTGTGPVYNKYPVVIDISSIIGSNTRLYIRYQWVAVGDPESASDWESIVFPAYAEAYVPSVPVTAVNGKIGNVTLAAGDIQTSNGYTVQYMLDNMPSGGGVTTVNGQSPNATGAVTVYADDISLTSGNTVEYYLTNGNDITGTFGRGDGVSDNKLGDSIAALWEAVRDTGRTVTVTAADVSTSSGSNVQNELDTLSSSVQSVQTTANNAQATANTAVDNASTAQQRAEDAYSLAESAYGLGEYLNNNAVTTINSVLTGPDAVINAETLPISQNDNTTIAEKLNNAVGFPDWSTVSQQIQLAGMNTVYTASSDGWLVIVDSFSTTDEYGTDTLYINDTEVAKWVLSAADMVNGGQDYHTFMIPVKSGDTFKITSTGTHHYYNAKLYPFKSN